MAKKNTVDLGAHERLGVYSVRNFNTKEGEEKSKWTQIGTAFGCKDGSLNVVLDHLPVGEGTINIRPFRERAAAE
ncbi:MAG: hypothetical protein HKP30_10085 [Myxococcales bacterium]|nr:hypothetical protein [Myxococcales bacterium]